MTITYTDTRNAECAVNQFITHVLVFGVKKSGLLYASLGASFPGPRASKSGAGICCHVRDVGFLSKAYNWAWAVSDRCSDVDWVRLRIQTSVLYYTNNELCECALNTS